LSSYLCIFYHSSLFTVTIFQSLLNENSCGKLCRPYLDECRMKVTFFIDMFMLVMMGKWDYILQISEYLILMNFNQTQGFEKIQNINKWKLQDEISDFDQYIFSLWNICIRGLLIELGQVSIWNCLFIFNSMGQKVYLLMNIKCWLDFISLQFFFFH
jgi:hypothetical protein